MTINVFAHSFENISTSKEVQWNKKRLSYMPIDRTPVINRDSVEIPGLAYLKQVVVLPNRWAQTQKINVCFVGGSDKLRNKILSIAQIWLEYTNLEIVSGQSRSSTCTYQDENHLFNPVGQD